MMTNVLAAAELTGEDIVGDELDACQNHQSK